MTDSASSPRRVLILFAHPALEHSRVQRQLLAAAEAVDGITVNDLYERYPDFDIDIEAEQQRLLEHDTIVFQHPFYWYSAPPLVKQWLDLVLEHGWAYGSAGTALHGKFMMQAVSAGGVADAYRQGGYNDHSIADFLLPFAQTAKLCGMTYLPPFAIYGTHKLDEAGIARAAERYQQVLIALQQGALEPADLHVLATNNEANHVHR